MPTKTELNKIPEAMRRHLGKMGMVGGRSRSQAKVEAAKNNFRAWHKKQGHKVGKD